MPSATGQNWEKYNKEFADDEEPEKKITPLSDEYVSQHHQMMMSCKMEGERKRPVDAL